MNLNKSMTEMNRTEMLQKCKEMGIKGVSAKNKSEIEAMLLLHSVSVQPEEHQPNLMPNPQFMKELVNKTQKDKPRKVCSNCHELGHGISSLSCKLVVDKTKKHTQKMKTYFLSQNCLDGKPIEEHLVELSGLLGITFNSCKTLYASIPPSELLDRRLDMDAYIENIRQSSKSCNECGENMICIQKNTNHVWKGDDLCDACWSNHGEERALLWEQIAQYKPTECVICGRKKAHYHYDHLNMFVKSDSVCSMVADGVSIEDICAEIDKCQIVCVPCHHIVTDIEHKLGFTRMKQSLTRGLNQGDITEEEHGAQTALCQKAYEDKMRDIYEELKRCIKV